MSRKAIIRSISNDLGLPQQQAREIVHKVFDAIQRILVEDGRVELRNFGVFAVQRRKPRRARNPRTGETVLVPEKSVVTFKPGLTMQRRVQVLGNHNQGAVKAAGPTMDQVESQVGAGAADDSAFG